MKIEKEQFIECVNFVIKSKNNDYVIDKLNSIINYINSNEYNYDKTMYYIQLLYSEKLGGVYMLLNRSLDYLKNEVKHQNKLLKLKQQTKI